MRVGVHVRCCACVFAQQTLHVMAACMHLCLCMYVHVDVLVHDCAREDMKPRKEAAYVSDRFQEKLRFLPEASCDLK